MDQKPGPGAAEARPEIETLLSELDRNQLVQVLMTLARDDSTFAGRIAEQIQRLKAVVAGGRSAPQPLAPTGSPRPPKIPVDVRKIRREVRSALHESYRHSSSYGEPEGVPDLGQYLDQAWELIRAGQGNQALDVLEAITAEVAGDIDSLADESGRTQGFLEHELSPAWTEAILTADLTPDQREDWGSKLDSWAGELDQYGYDNTFWSTSGALAQGWTDAALQRALSGKQREWATWAEENPHLDQNLITARINILERQGRFPEALNLARASGQSARYAALLLQLGRIGDAVEAAIAHFTTADEAFALAKELREKWEAEPALWIAQHGLTLEGFKGSLATWLSDYAAELGKGDLALSAAIAAFKANKDLATYQRVQNLAGPGWPERRDELLDYLRTGQGYYAHGAVGVFLHEHLIDDAIKAVDGSGSYETIERVARAAIDTRPEWVVKTGRSQAERIMDSGKAQHYDHAVDWLAIARDAYEQLGQIAAWEAYLAGLISKHARKYKLRPMLEDLR